MRIQHNIPAMSAYRNYTNNTSALSKNLEKLSSGYKINRAGDDAAGLAISEKMRAQITGLEVAQKNAKDGISLVQTAEGALTEVHDMLNRMYELAEQSANGTYQDEVDREQLQKEITSLKTEINRIADSANFNGIKLLDGSLSENDLTIQDSLKTDTIDMAKGVEVTQGKGGGGSKGTYSIDITQAFGDGDAITITFGGAAATIGDSSGASITLTYGTNFTGNSIDEQAKNLMSVLSGKIGSKFSLSHESGTGNITITSLDEGNDTKTVGTVTDVSVSTDCSATPDTSKWKLTAGVAGTGTLGNKDFAKLFDGNSGSSWDIPDGEELSFEFKLDNEQTLTVSLKEGVDGDFVKGNSTQDTINNIISALNKKTFDENADTFIEEGKIKVSDLFTISANTSGGIKVEDTAGCLNATGSVTLKGPGGAETSGNISKITGNAAATFGLDLQSGTGKADDLALGDKLTIEGKLMDGREFSIELEAGKEFKLGDDYEGTLTNIKSALEGDKVTVKIDGKESDVKSSDIFGDKKEIKIDTTNKRFESVNKGTKGSYIKNVTLDVAGAADVSSELTNGTQQSAAKSTINFSSGVAYGATIEVGGEKYEIVKSEDDVSSRKNNAVVVDDVSDTTAVAKAMADALNKNMNTSEYTATVSGSKVTVSSTAKGSTAKAISVSSSGDKVSQLEFSLDPEKMKTGSYVEINGQKYEFVEKGSKSIVDGSVQIEVDDFSKETSASLGSALADAANGVNKAAVQAGDDGIVKVRGMADAKGKIEDAVVKFGNGKAGLKLQIGDTAESFNQLKVGISDCHTMAMGIGNIDISTQDGATDAMLKIKDAVNYISDVRGTLGATQNRLDHTINNLSVMQENIQDAESTIRDVDVAKEMMEYTKNNILVQSAQAMLAQANQLPQGVLQLLQ